MEKIIISLVIIFLALNINAQTNTQPTTQQPATTQPVVKINKNAPIIEFAEIVYDYGKIEKNSPGTCQFTFKNKGKEPLMLENVRSSCGCTIPKWPKEPISPKKAGSIDVKYNTNKVGAFTKTITVLSNASNPTIILTIKGEVVDSNTQPAQEESTTPIKTDETLAPKAQ